MVHEREMPSETWVLRQTRIPRLHRSAGRMDWSEDVCATEVHGRYLGLRLQTALLCRCVLRVAIGA